MKFRFQNNILFKVNDLEFGNNWPNYGYPLSHTATRTYQSDIWENTNETNMYSSEGTFEINQESFFFSLKVVSTNYQLGRVESRDKFIPNLPLKKS